MVCSRVGQAAAALLLAASAGCTAERDPARTPATTSSPAASPSGASPARDPSAPSSSATPTTSPQPARFDSGAAASDVRRLAGRIGPRLATAASYRRAARLVADRFRRLGYQVQQQRFPVPAGDSWGVPVGAGTSLNVVALPPGFDPRAPHRLVGAHLDTVAVSPGAEDNASGVAVLLELARLAAVEATALPTVFVAFGAEEPRGPGDDQHHFGSRHYVARMQPGERRALRAMVSLDRVGVGRTVPVCTGPLSPATVQRQVLRVARRIDVPATACENTASDHWSFEKAGRAVARFGSTGYAAYHSPDDLPGVVSPAQLRRTGRLAWAWLTD